MNCIYHYLISKLTTLHTAYLLYAALLCVGYIFFILRKLVTLWLFVLPLQICSLFMLVYAFSALFESVKQFLFYRSVIL
jgi:hypothetical protein